MEFLLFNIYFLIIAVVYRALFDKQGEIKWNRWLLLTTPVFLCLIALINNSLPAQSGFFVVELDLINITSSEHVGSVASGNFSFMDWFLIAYVMGVMAFCVVHSVNFIKLYRLIKGAKFLKKYRGANVYESSFNASFSNTIFIKENLTDEEEKIILAHEFAHIRQKHSIDRVFALIVQTICWFNPGVYLWKADIEKNHEYLADQEVLSMTSREDYTLFLLEQRLNLKSNQIHLPLSNMSNLKSRVMRMNQKTRSVLSYLILPALAVGMMSSKFLPATQIEESVPISEELIQKESDPVEDPDEMAEFKGGVEALKTFLAKEVKYPKKSMEKKTEGKVFVEAVISKEGKVTKVNILRGVDEYIDAEAIRVFEIMPDWKPAKNDGKNVASIVRVPIKFTLGEKEKNETNENETK
ncbi:MAG: M56 family metallopeptidase [Brumimicrobium sp.]